MKNKRLLILVSLLVLVLPFIFAGCSSNVTQKKEEITVKNIKYIEKNSYKFTWDKLDKAISYNVKINNKIYNTTSNEFFYFPKGTDKSLSVRVQPVFEDGEKDWSSSITYIVEKQDTLFYNVLDYASDNVSGIVRKFLSANIFSDEDGKKLQIKLLVNNAGEEQVELLIADIDKITETSLNAIVKLKPTVKSNKCYIIARDEEENIYNSLSYLMQSSMSETMLKQYQNDGYKVDILSSYTLLGNKQQTGEEFSVHGVVKLTKGEVIKYFSYEYLCIINEPEKLMQNVTTKLAVDSERVVSEVEFNELISDYKEMMLF